MKYKKLLLVIPLGIMLLSCQHLKQENITTPSVVSVPQTVLLTPEIETYTDGVFLEMDQWTRVLLNIDNLQEEIELLRIELSKFE